MKRIFIVLLLLVMVVAISGCTTETVSNKTYNANGVTFTYPGNGSEQNSSSIQATVGSTGEMIAVVGDNSSFMFGIAKVNIGANQRLATLNEWATAHNSTIRTNRETFIRQKSMTIDGVNGIMLASNDSDFYYYQAFFIKNSTGYIAILLTESENQQLFDQIVSTLQINR